MKGIKQPSLTIYTLRTNEDRLSKSKRKCVFLQIMLLPLPMHAALIWYLKNQINTRVSNYTQQVQLEPKRTYMNHERMNNHETVVSV